MAQLDFTFVPNMAAREALITGGLPIMRTMAPPQAPIASGMSGQLAPAAVAVAAAAAGLTPKLSPKDNGSLLQYFQDLRLQGHPTASSVRSSQMSAVSSAMTSSSMPMDVHSLSVSASEGTTSSSSPKSVQHGTAAQQTTAPLYRDYEGGLFHDDISR